MKNLEEQLTAIGFGRNRSDPECWRTVRLDQPASRATAAALGPEPCSRDLLRWRAWLAQSRRPSPYRISRA